MPKYIMALDSGTTSNRCILFDQTGRVCSVAQKEFTQIFPQPGWVEHDADEIFATQLEVARQALRNIGAAASDIAAIGITNQRETTVVWNKITGRPVYHAIVWQCRRTADYCEALRRAGLVDRIRSKTGLVIDPYFSATKIRWILENVPGAREAADRGELLFGTVETWLIWKLTGGKIHATDYSNASRTMLFDINTLSWDAEILERLDIPAAMLPVPMPSSGLFGYTEPAFFGAPIAIAGAAGDQQAALFGQTCLEPGDVKCTYGTGAFLLMNTGHTPIFSRNGLVTTVAWGLDGRVHYALEGSIFVAGAAIQWLRDELRFVESASDSEYMARKVPDTNGCYVVPAFTGLGAPYWNPHARGTVVGLTRGVNKYHIIRATLDSIAYQVHDILSAMEADAGIRLSQLKVDGGASANNYLMQTQSDLSGAPVVRPGCVETTAMGAAYLAGLAVGYWKNVEDIRKNWALDRTFLPEISQQQRQDRLENWNRAVQCAMFWSQNQPNC
ncbi:MAG: glycerol kinase GlpK [Ruminococcaceae bacterium]|nr:glycerol kinase GlpK [Oscillospiraceae bacterium]